MKRCQRCKELLPRDRFHKNRARYDGLCQLCKDCNRTQTRENYWLHREKRLAEAAAYREANRERLRARDREIKRAERKTEAYRRAHAAYKAKWLKTEKGRAYNQAKSRNRHARQKGLVGSHTQQQLDARVAYYGGLCWVCRAPYEAIDHVKPVTAGGSNFAANLRPICGSCNSRKNNRWPFAA